MIFCKFYILMFRIHYVCVNYVTSPYRQCKEKKGQDFIQTLLFIHNLKIVSSEKQENIFSMNRPIHKHMTGQLIWIIFHLISTSFSLGQPAHKINLNKKMHFGRAFIRMLCHLRFDKTDYWWQTYGVWMQGKEGWENSERQERQQAKTSANHALSASTTFSSAKHKALCYLTRFELP